MKQSWVYFSIFYSILALSANPALSIADDSQRENAQMCQQATNFAVQSQGYIDTLLAHFPTLPVDPTDEDWETIAEMNELLAEIAAGIQRAEEDMVRYC